MSTKQLFSYRKWLAKLPITLEPPILWNHHLIKTSVYLVFFPTQSMWTTSSQNLIVVETTCMSQIFIIIRKFHCYLLYFQMYVTCTPNVTLYYVNKRNRKYQWDILQQPFVKLTRIKINNDMVFLMFAVHVLHTCKCVLYSLNTLIILMNSRNKLSVIHEVYNTVPGVNSVGRV